MKIRRQTVFTVLIAVILVAGCGGGLQGNAVRQSDLDAWRGRPVMELDLHPVFSVMDLNRITTDEGYEIRNYKNDVSRTVCHAFGCTAIKGGCNNQFIVHEGYVVEYRPTGYGGARCCTGESTRPGYSGPVNLLGCRR